MKPYEPEHIDRDGYHGIGEGWKPLVESLYDVYEALGRPVRIIQVKEKFGGLRVYTDMMHEAFDKAIIEAEKKSLITCELCGQKGKITQKLSGWYKVRCSQCLSRRITVSTEGK